MGNWNNPKTTRRRIGKVISPLDDRLKGIEWGEFSFNHLFNKIAQGRRLKKDDHISGSIPFVMAGMTNAGVANYISNPVASFPKNSITIDIFGNVFYRDYSFGAGDDTGVYWNTEKKYSSAAMKFFSIAMSKSVYGKFDYGNKLRSSQSLNFKMQLPTKRGKIDFDFMESFIADLEIERIQKLENHLTEIGLNDYHLSSEEKGALKRFENIKFKNFKITDILEVKNTGNILSRDITPNSGKTPYLCASSENNGVSSYISYDEKYIEKGDCIFIGGKTFVVSYQENDFFSNDSHNLVLYLKESKSKLNQLFLASCINKSLGHKYSWGYSISHRKIQQDKVALPVKDNKPDYAAMETILSAIQKLVIKDVILYLEKKKKELNKLIENTDA